MGHGGDVGLLLPGECSRSSHPVPTSLQHMCTCFFKIWYLHNPAAIYISGNQYWCNFAIRRCKNENSVDRFFLHLTYLAVLANVGESLCRQTVHVFHPPLAVTHCLSCLFDDAILRTLHPPLPLSPRIVPCRTISASPADPATYTTSASAPSPWPEDPQEAPQPL